MPVALNDSLHNLDKVFVEEKEDKLFREKSAKQYLTENFAGEFFVQMPSIFYDVKKILEIGWIFGIRFFNEFYV